MKKIIHYCWMGGPLPETVANTIRAWRTIHPSWEIMEWNGSNIDIEDCEYAKHLFKLHEWAYVSDYVRLQALYNFGGVYLDTDVEVRKPFDSLIGNRFCIGYMHNCALGTAVMISPPHHFLVGDLLALYRSMGATAGKNNNAIVTEYFLERFRHFRLTGKYWDGNEIRVYPKDWFEQPSFSHQGQFSHHHFHRSWSVNGDARVSRKASASHLVFAIKRMGRCWLEQIRSDYFKVYLRDRYGFPFKRWEATAKSGLDKGPLPKSGLG